VNTPARFAAFAATLAVLFAGGALAGGAVDPDRDEPPAETHGGAEERADAHGGAGTAEGHGGAAAARPIRGLAVAENGLRLVVENPELRRGRTQTLRFRIADERGATVRDFDVEHEKRMHLILARRDLTGFQHLHPTQAPDGSWSTRARLGDAGSYRLFADFSHEGEASTLAGDLRVDGAADLRPLPAPDATADVGDGYAVRLDAGHAGPGREADLRFTVTRDGRPVRTERYLGAGGHLVALREGDLAFLHVHPTAGTSFAATFPTAGRYRLFLQFQHAGRVRTAAFTQEVPER
jgi:hypothetical protein